MGARAARPSTSDRAVEALLRLGVVATLAFLTFTAVQAKKDR